MFLLLFSFEVKKWKVEGKMVKVEKNGKWRIGGWGKVFGDMEWFLNGENVRVGGKFLFLWGFSMVSNLEGCGDCGGYGC